MTRHYTKFSIKDYIKEQNEIWFNRIYKNKKVSHLKVFKKKIDINQYPGKKFWKKIIKKVAGTTDHSSNKNIIKFGQKIRSTIIKKHLGVSDKKIKFIDHSTGHAAYAFFSKRKKRSSLVITLDAFGDFINYTASKFLINKNQIIYKRFSKGSNSIIGRLYRYVTLILGLKPNEHEYKVMGLAPYAKEDYSLNVYKKVFKDILTVKNCRIVHKKKTKRFIFISSK